MDIKNVWIDRKMDGWLVEWVERNRWMVGCIENNNLIQKWNIGWI